MLSRSAFTATVLLLCPVALFAQAGGIRGPVSGFVYLGSSVRPLQGTPGASQLGPAVLSNLEWASVAPGGKWALVAKDGRITLIRGIAESAPSEAPLANVIAAVDRAAWSVDGSFAVVYSSSSAQIQRLRLAPTVEAETPTSIAAAGELTTLAIAPDGGRMVFGADGGLFTLAPGGTPIRLDAMARPAAAAFDPTGRRLYAVDTASQRILEFNSDNGAAQFASFRQTGEKDRNVIGLAVTADGRGLLLVDAVTRSVLVYDAETRTLGNTIPLDFAPVCVEPVSNNPAFLLNRGTNGEWLLILDAKQIPGVYFVPASEEQE